MHATDAFNPGDLAKQELLVGIHVRHHHLELVVGLLTGDQIAVLHFREAAHCTLKVLETLGGVAIHADLQDHGEVQPQCFLVQQGGAASDDAGLFQRLDPARTGRRRQADPLGQLLIGQAAVGLQGVENLPVVPVQFVRSFSHFSNKPSIFAVKSQYYPVWSAK